jgi:hypothetical protein
MIEREGTSVVTTEPAATTLPSPIVTLSKTIALISFYAFLLITIEATNDSTSWNVPGGELSDRTC